MATEDQIVQDMTPGMKLTILGACDRYNLKYSTAQKALRKLWRHEFLGRQMLHGGRLEYEGKQNRLL